MLMNRRDFLVKGGVVVGTSLIPNTALAVFGSSVRGTMGAAGAAGAGAAGDVTSYVLDGTGDYISIPDHADWDLGSGNWTIECWFRKTDTSGGVLIARWDSTDTNKSFEIYMTGGGVVSGYISTDGTATTSTIGTTNINDNAWHHVAYIRNGNVQTLYIDGTSEGTPGSESGSLHASSKDLLIGAQNPASPSEFYAGFVDQIRISDVARETGNFVPSTSQYTSDANTLLLIHGGEAYTAPLTGETTQSCVTFDGTGDYLTVPDHADWHLAGGDFTFECWARFNTASGTDILFGHADTVDGDDIAFQFVINAGSTMRLQYSTDGTWASSWSTINQSWSPSLDTWYHLAWVRSTTSLHMFVDGTELGSTASIGADSIFNASQLLYIGTALESGVTANYFDGHMNEIRISDTARWTANFTPPTERYTSDANTLLLIHGDENSGGTRAFTDSGNTGHTVTPTGNAFLGNGGTFTDSGNTGHTVTENGNAQRETEQEFKFADDGVGYFFDASGDWLGIPDHADFDWDSDFTIECWFYTTTNTPGDTVLFSHYVDSTHEINFLVQSTGELAYIARDGGVAVNIASATRSYGAYTWQHIALTRENDDYDFWVNGVNVGNATDSDTAPTLAGSIFIGQRGNGSNYLNGYIDELRVSDTARYTTGFTPSSTQFTSDANTLLLIHGGETKSGTTGSGATFTDSGNTGHTVTENGNAIESTGNFYKF